MKLPVWQVTVHDGDDQARETLQVWVVTSQQPVLPAAVLGPFRPIVLDGLAIEPFVNRDKCKPAWGGRQHRCGARVAFRFWARDLRAPDSSARTAPVAAEPVAAGNGRAER